MRRYLVSFGPVLALLLGVVMACGGGETPADQPQGGGSSSGGGGAAGGGGGASSSSADAAGPGNTTTVLVGDGGELQGTKLSTSGTITIDGGTTSGPKLNPNERDPGRSPEDIMTIIKSHRDEARACYDAALKTHPGIEGNIYITWKLDPKGKVTETGVDDSVSNIHDPGLVKCIGDVIRKISWAPSPRGVETRERYPFNFHPRGTQP